MSIETQESVPTTQEKLTARNELQKLLLEKAITEGILESDQDFDKMIKMFRTVSDIIDSDDPDYESIKSAYESGDYDGAVRMLLTIFRSE